MIKIKLGQLINNLIDSDSLQKLSQKDLYVLVLCLYQNKPEIDSKIYFLLEPYIMKYSFEMNQFQITSIVLLYSYFKTGS